MNFAIDAKSEKNLTFIRRRSSISQNYAHTHFLGCFVCDSKIDSHLNKRQEICFRKKPNVK